MATERSPDQTPEICHPFAAGVRLLWEHNDRALALVLDKRPSGATGAELGGMHYVINSAAGAAAMATLHYLEDFVGEVAFEDETGTHCYSPEEISRYVWDFIGDAYTGQLDSWESAHAASKHAAEKASLLLKCLTTGAYLNDEDRLRRLVRRRLPKEMSGQASR